MSSSASCPADVELIDVAKLPRGRSAQQEEINRIIVERALAGKRVVRFKGGDSFVFGRGFEEVLACREAGVPVTVVPGLTSPVSVPGLVGIPVTHRGVAHDFTVISGHLPPGHPESLTDWDAVARLTGTLVLMMAVENAPAIADVLLAGGRKPDTPVAVICQGSMPGERTVLSTLATLADDLGHGGGHAAGDHRGRATSWPWRTPTATPDGRLMAGSSRSPTRPTRAWPTTATCATSSSASTSRPSTACSSPRARRSYAARSAAGFTPRSFLMAPRWLRRPGRRPRDDGRALLRAVARTSPRRSPASTCTAAPWPRSSGVRCPPSRRSWPAPGPCWCSRTSSTTPTSAPIFRCGAAFGFDAVLLAPRCADPLYRRSIKVAMGAVFTLPWTRLPDWTDALPSLSRAGFTTVALTLADDAVPVEDAVAGVDRVALVLGSEGHGLSTRWEQDADVRAVIPMSAEVDSLNVAAAAAVACYVTSTRE